MTRQQRFEALWSDRHGLPVETLAQYRFATEDGYRLPEMAAHYRTFCATLDSVLIQIPKVDEQSKDPFYGYAYAQRCVNAIKASGVRVSE